MLKAFLKKNYGLTFQITPQNFWKLKYEQKQQTAFRTKPISFNASRVKHMFIRNSRHLQNFINSSLQSFRFFVA